MLFVKGGRWFIFPSKISNTEDEMKKRELLIIVVSLFFFLLTQSLPAQTWQSTKRLTWNSGESRYSAIAIGLSGDIHVTWHDNSPGNFEIYYKRSTDGGTTWQPTKRLTWNSGNSSYPAIAIDPSRNIHVVWSDDTPGNYEIYYKRSTDGGATWTTQRLTWNSGESSYPAIATDPSGNIHIVWRDNTPGNYEIYYKKGK